MVLRAQESELVKYYPIEYNVDRQGKSNICRGEREELYKKIAFVYPLLEAEEGVAEDRAVNNPPCCLGREGGSNPGGHPGGGALSGTGHI
ncbi:hypothetical protein HPB52_017308 [Rhipicephalus sanguineus]|uniref:Uncharacterized protein n=1 Tax=Rhipicephalus sanguineus TaxID=34632 RepID=A0A9D4QA82_RHISA|nr:hypothetical protein HPB52_017308 [Rhipicephalus sanguineus]